MRPHINPWHKVQEMCEKEMIHELKILPQFYERVSERSKTFEVRNNDRGFQLGDVVILREYNPDLQTHPYTGNQLTFNIGHVFPIDDHRVVFSLLEKK